MLITNLNITAKMFAKIWIVGNDYCNKKKTCPYYSFRSKICKKKKGLQK